MEQFVITKCIEVDASALPIPEIRARAEQDAVEWGGEIYTTPDGSGTWLLPIRKEDGAIDGSRSAYFLKKSIGGEEVQRMIDAGDIPSSHRKHWQQLLDGKRKKA